MQKLNINEIFASINGEVNKWGQGSPTIFVRLQGCQMNCSYCDTKYAQAESNRNSMAMKHLLTEIASFGIKRVTITGGEPLMQENVTSLISGLIFKNYQVSVETNGSINIPTEWLNWHNVCWVVDYKMEFMDQMIGANYLKLVHGDWIKFVIQDINDFDKAILIKNDLKNKKCRAQFAFSPAGASPELASQMVEWLIEEKIDDVILNLQIHKIISVK